MAKFQFNQLIKKGQFRIFMLISLGVTLLIALSMTLLSASHPKKESIKKTELDLSSVMDESFTEANAESAMTAQQSELESLKKEMGKLTTTLQTMMKTQEEQVVELNKNWQNKFEQLEESTQLKTNQALSDNKQPSAFQEQSLAFNGEHAGFGLRPAIHTISFRKKKRIGVQSRLNPAHYVPSNTTVKAVVLGGADADASVNGQSKNNGVMLFKLLDVGTLPNGQRSKLRGCRVSANTYGDISSERAFATLYRLSCAHPGQPIIDKEVAGWVFYNGKVGIKGQPLMRDNKVMTWAGISGALSGVAQAAQYAQSMQQLSPIGATSVVPSGNIAPFAAYGGASKAADQLSEYYVKRAEQYHPVIQVGAGNIVTIVFKDGFYLEPDEETERSSQAHAQNASYQDTNTPDTLDNFSVPPEVLNHIDKAHPAQTQSFGQGASQ